MHAEVERRTKSLRQKSGKPVGGQKGHPGCTREMVADPDKVVEVHSHFCKECGRDYGSRGKGCNAVNFGKRMRPLVTYLNVVLCIPYKRLQSMLSEVFGIRISQGTLANIAREMLVKSKPAIDLIERKIKKSPIVGFNESGCYCKGRLDWSWIAQTAKLTLVFRGSGRGAKVLEGRFGDSLGKMVAVTDQHSAYFAIGFLDNQVCLAHLLRNLEYLNGIDKEQT